MSDLSSAPGDSSDTQDPRATASANAADADPTCQTEPASEGPVRRIRRRTVGAKGWFGRDERHSVAFYGDFYR